MSVSLLIITLTRSLIWGIATVVAIRQRRRLATIALSITSLNGAIWAFPNSGISVPDLLLSYAVTSSTAGATLLAILIVSPQEQESHDRWTWW